MMDTIIKENKITFKELEQNIFRNICKIGQKCTREFLEEYDKHLMKERDHLKYRNKGYRKTTIKTGLMILRLYRSITDAKYIQPSL